MVITENGWPDDEIYNDKGRMAFMAEHLAKVMESINVYGCNIKGYATWSLMDNFEWLNGYTYAQDYCTYFVLYSDLFGFSYFLFFCENRIRFGIHSVNLDSPTKERKPKRSAKLYKRVIETRTVPDINSIE